MVLIKLSELRLPDKRHPKQPGEAKERCSPLHNINATTSACFCLQAKVGLGRTCILIDLHINVKYAMEARCPTFSPAAVLVLVLLQYSKTRQVESKLLQMGCNKMQ